MASLPPIKWRRSPNFSERTAGPVDLVVVHRPVGSYLGSIEALCDPAHQASTQGILGRPKPGAPLEFTQLVGWSKKAWACMAFNSRSDNLEIADAAWDGTDPEAWRVAARIVAFRLKKRGLKPRWARGGNGSGFCRHYDLGAAGGGHTDPTTSTVQWLRFVARVKWEFLRGGFVDSWGYDSEPLNVVLATATTTSSSGSNVTVTFKPTPPVIVKKPKPSPVKPKAPAKKKPEVSAVPPDARPKKKAAPKKTTAKPAAPKKATPKKPSGGATRKPA